MPGYLRQLREKGPAKLRGQRSVEKTLREMKIRESGSGALQALPAPGSAIFREAVSPAQAPAAPPVMGNVDVLTLLVSFSDVGPWEDPAYFDSLVYGGAAPSLSHYYDEVSGGSLSLLTGNLPSSLGWLALPGTKADYGGDPRAMLQAAVDAADGAVDFSRYDNDGDGFVDYLIIVHVGSGAEWSGDYSDLWSQTLTVPAVATADDDPASGNTSKIRIDTFMTVPEYWMKAGDSAPTPMTIGVYAHEFGHLLGLPDLYDYGLDSKGIGDWGLMSYGMWNGTNRQGDSPSWVSAWGRVTLGWATPVAPVVDAPGVTLPPVEQGGPVYYLWNHGTANSEFFLIENRQKLAGTYDASLPGSGLLIWHVDETMPDNETPIPYADALRHQDCAWPAHYRVALQQADGFMNLEQPLALSNRGDIADPYPGSFTIRTFSPTSTVATRYPPNSGSYANCDSLVAVRNITLVGTSITADVQVAGADRSLVADDAWLSLAEDASADLTLTGSDPDGYALEFILVTEPAHGTLNGTAPDLTYTPEENYHGPDSFTFKVNDGYTDSNTATVSITVTPVNDPPALQAVGDRALTEGDILSFALSAADVDGDALTFGATGLPDGASLDADTGAFAWTPGFDQAGSYLVTFRVGDGAFEDEETITITVDNPSGPIFSDLFSNPALSKPGWTTVAGTWRWSATQGVLSATSLTTRNLARIARLDPVGLPLGAGVIRATVNLTARAGAGGPNGMILFGYRNAANHRWVRITPDGIQIGQTGALDGIPAGIKKKVTVRQAVGKPALFTVKVWLDGLVQVFKGSATTPALAYRFTAAGSPSVVRGGVGLGALRARTAFDNVRVWEDSALGQ